MPACLFSICTRLGPTPRALKYQDLRQKHQSAISEARMRSRLGIAISAGKLDLMNAARSGRRSAASRPHLALFYRCVFDAGEAAQSAEVAKAERAKNAV